MSAINEMMEYICTKQNKIL